MKNLYIIFFVEKQAPLLSDVLSTIACIMHGRLFIFRSLNGAVFAAAAAAAAFPLLF